MLIDMWLNMRKEKINNEWEDKEEYKSVVSKY